MGSIFLGVLILLQLHGLGMWLTVERQRTGFEACFAAWVWATMPNGMILLRISGFEACFAAWVWATSGQH